MAEPIGIVSGIVALTLFAIKSCQSLHQCIQSISNNTRNIRDLKNEVGALAGVLQSLQGNVASDGSLFEKLTAPVLYCGQACEEFNKLLDKCIKHPDNPKTSVGDWARLMYAGNDIVGFKHVLAGYKQTISIAIGDANL